MVVSCFYFKIKKPGSLHKQAERQTVLRPDDLIRIMPV